MKDGPERLQGTDGVRGEAAAADDPRVAGLSPVETFTAKGLITSAFVKLYCRAFVRFLRENGMLREDGAVAVGYDPRDPERLLVEAALDGVRSAGAAAIDAGILPTPALGMFVVSEGLDGGIMITASHNPADQNGVKLFLPGTGIKPFPAEDRELTALICALEGVEAEEVQRGRLELASEQAGECFTDFFADSFNTWLPGSSDFNDIVLIADCANGALTPHIREILERFNFRGLEYVGMSAAGAVNENCGAGLLEGHRRIDAEFQTDAGADLRSVELVQAMFRHGRVHREVVGSGGLRVCGAAFDADGDRCYCLEYDAPDDAVVIFSGDEVAYHQGRFIRKVLGDELSGVSVFATTVESDINVQIAAEEMGFIPVSTGVGDKWLLWEAWCAQLGNYWDILEAQSTDLAMLADLEKVREEFENSPEPRGGGILLYQREAEEVASANGIDISQELMRPDMVSFAIGSEETGHCVTASRLKTKSGVERIAFFGNGLKSAVNWLAATEDLRRSSPAERFRVALLQPFPPGYKRTFPVYYTDQRRLERGSAVMRQLERRLLELADKHLDGRLTPEVRPRDEEPDMLYIALSEAAETRGPASKAALFVRNSGTEAKTSLYVRCGEHFADAFDAIAREGVVLLSRLMKDMENPYAAAEVAVLRRIAERGPQQYGQLTDLLGDVNGKRLIMEMSLKEQLVEPRGDRLALTGLGAVMIEAADGG